MHGMFRANGGCGYVKKPDFLLKAGDVIYDTLLVKMTLRVGWKVCGCLISVKMLVSSHFIHLLLLQVTLYMGEGWFYDFHHTYFDTYSPPDFYARVHNCIAILLSISQDCSI